MVFYFRSCGYLLLQHAIAIFCVSIALSIIITLHIHSLHVEHAVRAKGWATINAASARHIQQHYSSAQAIEWQDNLIITLPSARSHIQWHPNGAMQMCWEGNVCWQLN